MPRYELPKVDGFTEEQVRAELEAQGRLDEYLVPDDPAPQEEATVQSDPAPAPPEEGVTDEPEASTRPKTIPYERFAEAQRKAREREAEYQKQLDEFRRQQAELLKEQQAFLRKQMEERAPKPEPVEEDPLKVLIRTEAEEMVKPLRQQLMAQQQMTALQERIAKAEAEVEKAFPDYKAITAPVQARMAEAAVAAQRGDASAAQWLSSILMDENPPLKAYMIGKWEMARNQTASNAPVQPQRTGTPPALPRGMQVQGTSSSDASSELARIVDMSPEEYAAWRKKNPALAQKYMRGEF